MDTLRPRSMVGAQDAPDRMTELGWAIASIDEWSDCHYLGEIATPADRDVAKSIPDAPLVVLFENRQQWTKYKGEYRRVLFYTEMYRYMGNKTTPVEFPMQEIAFQETQGTP